MPALFLDEIRNLLGVGQQQTSGTNAPAQTFAAPDNNNYSQPTLLPDVDPKMSPIMGEVRNQAQPSYSPQPAPAQKSMLDFTVDDFDLDPNKVAYVEAPENEVQIASEAFKGAVHIEQMEQELAQEAEAKGQPDPAKVDWLERVKGGMRDFFGDEEAMYSMALAFNSLRHRPDQAFAASLQKRLEGARNKRQLAEAMPMIEQQYPQYAGLVKAGVITPKEMLTLVTKNPTKLSQMVEMLQSPEGMAQLKKLKEMGVIGAADTTIKLPGENKYAEEYAKSTVKFQDQIRERAQASADLMNSLNRFSAEVGNLGASGNWEVTKKEFRELASRFGFDVDEKALSAAQSVDAAARLLVATELRKNKGPQTDFDAMYTEKFVPSLSNLAETNEAISRYMRSTSRLDMLKAQFMDERITGVEFAEDRDVIRQVRLMNTQIPAVAPNPMMKGQFIMFDEYYDRARSENRSTKDILRLWMKAINKPVPGYLQ